MSKNIGKKSSIKRQKIDRQRALRVVKYLDYPFILENSPVELEESYIVSDRDTCDVFASFIFKNVSNRGIKSLEIRLACYQNQNIPYTNVDFVYSQNDLTFGIIQNNGKELKFKESNDRAVINQSESFGSCVYIPLPENYFKKMDIILLSVEYENGEKELLNTVVAGKQKRYRELDDISKLVYARVNIYQSAEERYPTKVIPQFGEKVWMCCCGNKNPFESTQCETCGREKEWLKNTVASDVLEETKKRMVNDPREVSLHDKSKFKQNKFLETESEIEQKVAQYENAMKNIATEERMRQRRQLWLIPKIILVGSLLYLIVLGINLFINLFR